MNESKTKEFVAAMKEYFGLLPRQTTFEFHAEAKILPDEDSVDFWRMLLAAGLLCWPPISREQPKPAA